MPVYTDVELMLRDIEGYVRTTGEEILVADDPMRGMVGFTTAETGRPPQRWEASLLTVLGDPDLRSRFAGRSETRVGLAREIMSRVGLGVATPEEVVDLEVRWAERVRQGERGRGGGVQVDLVPRRVEDLGVPLVGRRSGGSVQGAVQSLEQGYSTCGGCDHTLDGEFGDLICSITGAGVSARNRACDEYRFQGDTVHELAHRVEQARQGAEDRKARRIQAGLESGPEESPAQVDAPTVFDRLMEGPEIEPGKGPS